MANSLRSPRALPLPGLAARVMQRVMDMGTAPVATTLMAVAAACLSTPCALAANGILSGDALRGPVRWSADSMSLDYQSHQITLRGAVKITQGDVSVVADQAEATGLDAQDSHWVFSGKVHVHAEGEGELQSDRATVQFSHSNVARVVVTGEPAQFEQAGVPGGGQARGHAGTIDYDVVAGIVRLTDDAWLSDGRSELTYPLITYNVRQKSLQAEGGRGHSIVAPRASRDARKK